MLPEELPPRDPLENPPPDPPRAFANERVGTPTRANTRHAAMNFVVFKLDILSLDVARDVRSDLNPGSSYQ